MTCAKLRQACTDGPQCAPGVQLAPSTCKTFRKLTGVHDRKRRRQLSEEQRGTGGCFQTVCRGWRGQEGRKRKVGRAGQAWGSR